MDIIKSSNWFVIENSLTISLKKYFVYIDIKTNGCDISFQLKVIDNNNEQVIFSFETLEEAIVFTEDTISKCDNLYEIIEKYKEYYNRNKNNNIEEKSNKIILTPNEVDQALFEHFSEGKDYQISIKEDLTIENNNPKISFYLIEHIDKDKEVSTLLTNEDLKNALNDYISFYNYKLIDFKYIGGIHKVGYYFDNDTPYYEGIELKVKKLDKRLILKK